MELSKAIERVERDYASTAIAIVNLSKSGLSGAVAALEEHNEALALVLEAAKRPGVSIEYRGRAKPKPFYGDEVPTLAGPGFTVEELKRLARMVDSYWSYPGATSRQYEDELRAKLAAKLDAYLEGLINGGTE